MQWHDDPLYRDYQRLLAGGTKPNLAKVTLNLARKIADMRLAYNFDERDKLDRMAAAPARLTQLKGLVTA